MGQVKSAGCVPVINDHHGRWPVATETTGKGGTHAVVAGRAVDGERPRGWDSDLVPLPFFIDVQVNVPPVSENTHREPAHQTQ